MAIYIYILNAPVLPKITKSPVLLILNQCSRSATKRWEFGSNDTPKASIFRDRTQLEEKECSTSTVDETWSNFSSDDVLISLNNCVCARKNSHEKEKKRKEKMT